MSPDVIGMVIALFAFAVTVLGGVAGMLSRQTKAMDSRLDAFEVRVNQRFDRLDDRFDRLDDRVTRVEGELVEVKVAIARIEGPRPRLQQL